MLLMDTASCLLRRKANWAANFSCVRQCKDPDWAESSGHESTNDSEPSVEWVSANHLLT